MYRVEPAFCLREFSFHSRPGTPLTCTSGRSGKQFLHNYNLPIFRECAERRSTQAGAWRQADAYMSSSPMTVFFPDKALQDLH